MSEREREISFDDVLWSALSKQADGADSLQHNMSLWCFSTYRLSLLCTYANVFVTPAGVEAQDQDWCVRSG